MYNNVLYEYKYLRGNKSYNFLLGCCIGGVPPLPLWCDLELAAPLPVYVYIQYIGQQNPLILVVLMRQFNTELT